MHEFLSGFAIANILILLVISIRDLRHSAAAQAMILLLLCATAFIAAPFLTGLPRSISQLTLNGVPAAFWLWCYLLFTDQKKLPLFWLVIAAITVFNPLVYVALRLAVDLPEPIRFILVELPRAFELLLLANGFWNIGREYNLDMIEHRRSLRVKILAVVGLAVLVNVISMNLGIGGSELRLVTTALTLTITTLAILGIRQQSMFTSRLSVLPGNKPQPSAKTPSDVIQIPDPDIQALQQLNQLMDQGFYRTNKLTLKQLAENLDCPEYRVRRLISDQLGFRNFNDYINKLRIEEAATRLINEPDTPITNISLDVGYRIASSFNRAFKENQGVSPTQYRESKRQ